MTHRGWNAIAKWRDHRMGEGGDLWHRALIDPTLLRVLGPVRGLEVLDVACGNGYLTRRLKRRGAARAVGIDASLPSIRLARAREARRRSGAEFVHGDITRLTRFDAGSFDRIVANMAIMDIRDADRAIREMGRLLRPEGRVVFSINHPCFEVDERSGWLIERHWYQEQIYRKVAGYRLERPVRIPWKISEGEFAYTTAFHRTLATYSRYLREAGLGIVRMEEPSPAPELIQKSPQGRLIAEIPLHLVVEAALWDRGRRRPQPRPSSRRS